MTVRIEAGLLIPGRGDPIEHGVVVADGATIVYAGPGDQAPGTVDAETTVVPVIMPGLWDAHAHFIGIEKPDLVELITTDIPHQVALATDDMKSTLMGGVTSVREVGGHGIDMQGAVASGRVLGPSVHGAGRIVSTTGGHGDIHSIPLDVVHTMPYIGILADGVPEVLKAVRTNLRKNAQVIKICASGGVMSEIDHPIHQQFSDEELTAVVEEAWRAERYVAAHCHGKPGIMAALRAGVQTIEHGSYIDEEAAELMAEQGTIYVPTRFVVDRLLHMEDILPSYAYKKGLMIADAHAAAMKIAIARGVKIAMGTDIFVSGDLYGQNSYEIKLLQDAGMTALDAIEAATANGPDTLGPQGPRSGQLREGYDADLIAIDFNPLEDNSGWGDPNRVTHVWKGGTGVKRPQSP